MDYARKLLENSHDMIARVRSFDRASHTISIGCCAPMPMMKLVQKATRLCGQTTISSDLKNNEVLLQGLHDNTYQIIVLPF